MAGGDAVRRGEPTPFVCHVGFGCITASALPDPRLGFTLTFGPYCPAEESRSLETDVLDGVEALLSERPATLPVSLADIHVVPASAVPAVAQWTLDALRDLWNNVQPPEPSAEVALPPDVEPDRPRPRGRVRTAMSDPYQGKSIAAALAGARQDTARGLVRAAVAEARSGERARVAVKRARLVAVVGAVLEAAERSGADTETCWGRFSGFLEQARRARTDSELTRAAMDLLGILKRAAVRTDTPSTRYIELNQILLEHLVEGITLNKLAARLKQKPNTITRRLERKFGMSFTEYLGRLRVDKAKELLRRTRLSVTQVGRRVGVPDTANFCRLFRRFERITPGEYRKQFGGRS
jgi:AraC-like DNA-binding protein